MVTLHLLNIVGQIIDKPSGLPNATANNTTVANVINTVLNISGAIALVIVTLAGFKYVISRGEPQSVAKAKDTIIYAIVGLVIVIMAKIIVAFVFNKVGPS